MSLKKSKTAISAIVVTLCLLGAVWYAGQHTGLQAAPVPVPAVNPLHGTYEGGYWGNVPGLGPYGGDVKLTVSTAGVAALSKPVVKANAGTITPAGVSSGIKGSLVVNGNTIAVTYTGNFVPTKDSAGRILAVTGSGTWKTTTSGVNATGKWLIRRTLLTP